MTLNSDIKQLFECQKVTLFVFNKRLHEDIFREVMHEKARYIHSVDFHDTMSIEKNKVMAIARSEEELCHSVAFPSVIQIHKDVIRRKDALAVCMRQHRKEGEVTCLL